MNRGPAIHTRLKCACAFVKPFAQPMIRRWKSSRNKAISRSTASTEAITVEVRQHQLVGGVELSGDDPPELELKQLRAENLALRAEVARLKARLEDGKFGVADADELSDDERHTAREANGAAEGKRPDNPQPTSCAVPTPESSEGGSPPWSDRAYPSCGGAPACMCAGSRRPR